MKPKSDRTTLFGVVGALAVLLLSMILGGSSPMALLKPGPLLLIFGGTTAAAAAGFLRGDVRTIPAVARRALTGSADPPAAEIERMVGLAEVARREGLLALEKHAAEVTDPFFRKAVELTVDGTDPEEVEDILEQELESLRERHRVGAKFFADMGGFSPTLGILGTVVGLIHVLGSLSTPSKLGPAIAEAFVATLWGVLAANLLWLPISNKLKRLSDLEMQSKRLVMDGILAIQAGQSPRMVQARLLSHLPPGQRVTEASQDAA